MRPSNAKAVVSGISLILLVGLVLTRTRGAALGGQEEFKDLESFRDSLDVGIIEERPVDINADGVDDILVFSSGGEEIYLDLLVRGGQGFTAIWVPTGLSYDVLGEEGGCYLRVGTGTFPLTGDPHGPDQGPYWYDFYTVRNRQLVLVNSLHSSFYKEMIPAYERRIVEKRNEAEAKKAWLIANETDPEIAQIIIQYTLDHIQKYQGFIGKAREIIDQSRSE